MSSIKSRPQPFVARATAAQASAPAAAGVKLSGAKTAKDVEAWFSTKYGSVEAIKSNKARLTAASNEVRKFVDGRDYSGPTSQAYTRALQLDAELKRFLR